MFFPKVIVRRDFLEWQFSTQCVDELIFKLYFLYDTRRTVIIIIYDCPLISIWHIRHLGEKMDEIMNGHLEMVTKILKIIDFSNK